MSVDAFRGSFVLSRITKWVQYPGSRNWPIFCHKLCGGASFGCCQPWRIAPNKSQCRSMGRSDRRLRASDAINLSETPGPGTDKISAHFSISRSEEHTSEL